LKPGHLPGFFFVADFFATFFVPTFISSCGFGFMRTSAPIKALVPSTSDLGFAMLDKEPLSFPSRKYFPLSVGIADRQLWAIGMVVTQWGMTEFIREQEIYNLMGDDAASIEQYKRVRHSQLKTKFWKSLIETKKSDSDRLKWLDLLEKFETLNNHRDDIVHRLWGGGIQAGCMGAPDGAPTIDAALHRNRDEKIKTKSVDGRANLRWRLTFKGLKEIAVKIAQLNNDMLASWLPPNSPPGEHDIWAYTLPSGQLALAISSRPTEGDPNSGDQIVIR
jgi:hypothetical protein